MWLLIHRACVKIDTQGECWGSWNPRFAALFSSSNQWRGSSLLLPHKNGWPAGERTCQPLQRRLQFLNCSYGVTCVGDYRSPKGMTSSLIKNSMVSSSQSSTLLSSSSVSTPGGHMTILARKSATIKRLVARALGSPTSSEWKPDTLLFLVDLARFLPIAAVIVHHGPALVHQLLLPSKHKLISD